MESSLEVITWIVTVFSLVLTTLSFMWRFRRMKHLPFLWRLGLNLSDIGHFTLGIGCMITLLSSENSSAFSCKLAGFFTLYGIQDGLWTGLIVIVIFLAFPSPLKMLSNVHQTHIHKQFLLLFILPQKLLQIFLSILPVTPLEYFEQTTVYAIKCLPMRGPSEKGSAYYLMLDVMFWLANIVTLVLIVVKLFKMHKTVKTKIHASASGIESSADISFLAHVVRLTIIEHLLWFITVLLVTLNLYSETIRSYESVTFLLALCCLVHAGISQAGNCIGDSFKCCVRRGEKEVFNGLRVLKKLEYLETQSGVIRMKSTWMNTGSGEIEEGLLKVYQANKLKLWAQEIVVLGLLRRQEFPSLLRCLWTESSNPYSEAMTLITGKPIDPSSRLICVDILSLGSLRSLLDNLVSPLKDGCLKSLICDIADGLSQLHLFAVQHNYVSSKNIYVRGTLETQTLAAAVGNFEHSQIANFEDSLPFNSEPVNYAGVDNPLVETDFTFPSDIRAFALVLLEIIARNHMVKFSRTIDPDDEPASATQQDNQGQLSVSSAEGISKSDGDDSWDSSGESSDGVPDVTNFSHLNPNSMPTHISRVTEVPISERGQSEEFLRQKMPEVIHVKDISSNRDQNDIPAKLPPNISPMVGELLPNSSSRKVVTSVSEAFPNNGSVKAETETATIAPLNDSAMIRTSSAGSDSKNTRDNNLTDHSENHLKQENVEEIPEIIEVEPANRYAKTKYSVSNSLTNSKKPGLDTFDTNPPLLHINPPEKRSTIHKETKSVKQAMSVEDKLNLNIEKKDNLKNSSSTEYQVNPAPSEIKQEAPIETDLVSGSIMKSEKVAEIDVLSQWKKIPADTSARERRVGLHKEKRDRARKRMMKAMEARPVSGLLRRNSIRAKQRQLKSVNPEAVLSSENQTNTKDCSTGGIRKTQPMSIDKRIECEKAYPCQNSPDLCDFKVVLENEGKACNLENNDECDRENELKNKTTTESVTMLGIVSKEKECSHAFDGTTFTTVGSEHFEVHQVLDNLSVETVSLTEHTEINVSDASGANSHTYNHTSRVSSSNSARLPSKDNHALRPSQGNNDVFNKDIPDVTFIPSRSSPHISAVSDENVEDVSLFPHGILIANDKKRPHLEKQNRIITQSLDQGKLKPGATLSSLSSLCFDNNFADDKVRDYLMKNRKFLFVDDISSGSSSASGTNDVCIASDKHSVRHFRSRKVKQGQQFKINKHPEKMDMDDIVRSEDLKSRISHARFEETLPNMTTVELQSNLENAAIGLPGTMPVHDGVECSTSAIIVNEMDRTFNKRTRNVDKHSMAPSEGVLIHQPQNSTNMEEIVDKLEIRKNQITLKTVAVDSDLVIDRIYSSALRNSVTNVEKDRQIDNHYPEGDCKDENVISYCEKIRGAKENVSKGNRRVPREDIPRHLRHNGVSNSMNSMNSTTSSGIKREMGRCRLDVIQGNSARTAGQSHKPSENMTTIKGASTAPDSNQSEPAFIELPDGVNLFHIKQCQKLATRLDLVMFDDLIPVSTEGIVRLRERFTLVKDLTSFDIKMLRLFEACWTSKIPPTAADVLKTVSEFRTMEEYTQVWN